MKRKKKRSRGNHLKTITAGSSQLRKTTTKIRSEQSLQIFINLFIYFTMRAGNWWRHSQYVNGICAAVFPFSFAETGQDKRMKHYLFGHFNHQFESSFLSHSLALPYAACAAFDKLFMGIFPHNFASTCFAPFDIHADEDYGEKLQSYGSSRRIIQLSYFCGTDDIQYAPRNLRCFLSLSSPWWLSGQFISLPWLLFHDYIL